MEFAKDPLLELIIPNTAGPNDSAVLIEGTNMPPCMQATYTAGVFWRAQDSQTGTLLLDSPLFYIAVRNVSGNVTTIDYGQVVYDPNIPYCDYAVHEQVILTNSGGIISYERVLGSLVPGVPQTRLTTQNVLRVFQDSGLQITDGASIQSTGYIPYASTYLSSNGAVNSPLTPAFATIPNTLVTQDAFRTSDVFDVWGAFDMMQAIAGANVGIGLLLVDGVAEAQQANYRPGAVGARAPATRFWEVTGLAAGSHTFQLAISATLLNSFTVNPVHTSIKVNPRY